MSRNNFTVRDFIEVSDWFDSSINVEIIYGSPYARDHYSFYEGTIGDIRNIDSSLESQPIEYMGIILERGQLYIPLDIDDDTALVLSGQLDDYEFDAFGESVSRRNHRTARASKLNLKRR